MGSNRAGVGYDVKSIIGNRCVAGSIWSGSKSKLKAKAKAKSKSRLKRDETRARGELGRKVKLILSDASLQVLYYKRSRKSERIGAGMETLSKCRNRRNTEKRRKN